MAYIIDSKINSRSYLNNPDATVSAKDFQSGIAGAGRTYGEMYGNSIELLYTPDYNQRMDTLGKAILQVYAQNGVGNNVSSPYKYAIDSLISNLYGISLAEATRKHKSFVRAFTGEELEDKSLIEAFADSWRSDTINSQIARLQNDFTDSEDEEERAMLRKKIEKLQYEQIKLGDYSDRGWLGNSVVASAPLFKQIAEMALYTAGGNYLSAGLGLLAQGTGLATKAAKLIETSKLISKAAKVGKFASKAVGGIGGAAYWLTSLYPTMKGLADLQLYELEDYAGRKLDDETRNRASTLIALAQVALNIITPEPAFNKFLCNKVFSGKINDIISSKVSNMILQRGVEALVGATFESLEEGGEDFVYSLGEDIVKAYSNETGDTAFDIPSAGDSLGKALSSAANTFKDMFLPSLLVGGLGQGIEFAGDYMSHKVEMAERNEAPLSPEETNSAQDRQQATERSQTVRTGKLVFKRKAPSKSFMDSISEMDGEGNSHAKREKLPPVKVQRVFKWGHEYLEPVDNYNKDLAKYLRNQGVDAIMVEVEDNAEMSSTSADIGNIAKSFDGTFDAETDTIYIKPEATSNFRMTLEEEGFIVNRTEEGELSFSYTDENNQRHTISIVEDEELAGRQTNTTTETEEEMAFQEEEFAESVDESVAETDTTGNPDLQPDERRTGDGDFDSTENINTTQTEDTETLRRDRREKISRAVTKATKGRINPTDSRTLASLFDYMTPEVQSAILKENPDGTFIIDEQEMQKRFGKSLPKNKRGATILNRLQMVLSPRSDATTFVHESVHLAGAANPQLFADLAMSYLDAVTDPVESENLMKFLDENRRITGKEANEAFEILSSLPEDGRFSEEQEELASNVFVAALRAYDENSDSYYNLPAPIMRAYRAIASLIKNIYQGITGRTRLPKAVMDSYSRFFFSLEGTSETPDIQTQRRDIEASLFSTKLTSDTLADIDSLSKNDIGKPNVTIRFSAHTPVVFQALGMRDLPVEAYRDKMARSTLLSPSNDHGHNDSVNIEILKAVADMFGNPLFVFDSSSRKGDFVAVYPILGINENHTPVMISIHPDASANRIEVNLITSFYAKDNENTFKNWTDQGLLRYVDDINNSEVALAVRLQLPSGVTTSSHLA